jgi:hypothetical protein
MPRAAGTLKGFDVVRDVDGTPQEVAAGRERD